MPSARRWARSVARLSASCSRKACCWPCIGGVLGLGLSWAATKYFATLGNNNLPQGMPIAMDARVLLFMLAISVLTGILFGIFPALQLSRTNVNETLRDEGRGSTGGHRRVQLRGLLVVGQVALSLMLLIGAGLLVRSFSRLLARRSRL